MSLSKNKSRKATSYRGTKSVWLLAFLWLFAACAPSPSPVPLATSTTLPPSDTPTPTIIWFPPTATATLFLSPTVQPTPDQRPGIGTVILTDNFNDPTAWTQERTALGSVAVTNHELTIAITEEHNRAYLYSVRHEPIFANFYAEITASPSLCRGKDEYGFLLRVTPGMDYYRFSLACDGHLRLDRVVNGQASSPQAWLLSGAVPPGAPSSSRLAVWAYGAELRFFVNDFYQFSIKDPLLSSGGLGVFARSASEMAVTVNFSDLEVSEISSPPPIELTSTPSIILSSTPDK